ncbi:MAG: thiamine pyrophosphate-binding protein, partial [Deltaproteobacteria bacterium]|nr:thiamine pyrophosphate-binding protein [Deltaproteobacteria bacterium]
MPIMTRDSIKQRPALESVERPQSGKDITMAWGSDAVAEVLRQLGIKFIALVPGSSYRCLHDSLVNYLGNEQPQILLALHEEHAVAVAHGYAKVTEQPMAVALHSNVGLMHASMAIFNAWCDRVPVLILGATGPVDTTRRRPWIDWIHTARDQGALVRPFTKWDDQPASPEAAVEAMVRAWQIARRPPQGPTHICLPVEVQEQRLDKSFSLPDLSRFRGSERVYPDPEAITAAAALLRTARNVVMMVGRVSRRREDWDMRVQLAERLNARVITDSKAAAAFPTSHRLHYGAPQLWLAPESAELLRSADVVLNLNWIDLAGALKTACGTKAPDARIIHVSADALNHNGWSMDYMGLPPVDIEILAEPDAILAPLLEALGPGSDRKQAEPGAPGEGRALKRAPRTNSPALAPTLELDLEQIAACLGSALGDRTVSLIRTPLSWPGDRYDFCGPLDYLGYDGGAGIGSGPGMAVGAALALRNSDYIPLAVLGDGDYLMGVTALWTAVRYSIPLLVIVANNRSYYNAAVHQQMVARLRGRPPENKWIGQKIIAPDIDLAAMARA